MHKNSSGCLVLTKSNMLISYMLIVIILKMKVEVIFDTEMTFFFENSFYVQNAETTFSRMVPI